MHNKKERLTNDFFKQDSLTIAQALIGKGLSFHNYHGIILETEAYIGTDDPACHAARGRTKRTDIMYQEAGVLYVYLIYGMYYCLNIVTEEQGFPAAILIRGLYLMKPAPILLDGPGKLCRHLAINRSHNAINITQDSDCYLTNTNLSLPYQTTKRIGISKGTDKPWRFIANHQDLKLQTST